MPKPARLSVFEYYTYQISPTRIMQLDLFGKEVSVAELRERKNELFESILRNKDFHFFYKGHRLQHKIIYDSDNMLLLKLANIKPILAEKDFVEVVYDNEPSIVIAINNNPKNQSIAIQRNLQVFSNPEAVIELFKLSIASWLIELNLQIEINNNYEPDDFWEIAKKYQNQIRELRIELVRENMSDIYASVSSELVAFTEYNNAQKTIIIQEAPKGEVLQHINKKNKGLNGFVEASAKGTGPISVKIIGSRRVISTKNKTKKKDVNVVEINNVNPDVLKNILKDLFN